MKTTNTDNPRLSAALKVTKKKRIPNPRGTFTSRSAAKARKAYLDKHTFVPTVTMKVQEDARTLARSAWKNCHERVSEVSQAIRDRALAKIRGRQL